MLNYPAGLLVYSLSERERKRKRESSCKLARNCVYLGKSDVY